MENKTKNHLLASFFLSLAATGALLMLSSKPGQVGGISIKASNPQLAAVQRNAAQIDFEISAKSALIKDLRTNLTLYAKDPGQKLPIASLTKLMTAVVAAEKLSFDEAVEISREDIKTVPFVARLVPGEELAVADLLRAMLVASANDAALALARKAGGDIQKFVQEMNHRARAMGMSGTSFTNPVGFDDPNHYSTASDLAKLVEEFLTDPNLSEIVSTKEAVIISLDKKLKHKLITTNKLMVEHPEITGIKTGYTEGAKGNLIISTGPYYSIILGSEDREADTLKILDWVRRNFPN